MSSLGVYNCKCIHPDPNDYWSYTLYMSSYLDLQNILECEFHLQNFASAPVVGSQEQRWNEFVWTRRETGRWLTCLNHKYCHKNNWLWNYSFNFIGSTSENQDPKIHGTQ